MEKISKFFVNRSMLVNLIVILMVIIGIESVLTNRKEGFPEISLNKIVITTIYPGASSEDVERNVTLTIEESLQEVEGIKEVLSVSKEGMSIVEVSADDNATPKDFEKLYQDVDNSLTKIDDLPEEINGRPIMRDITSSDVPVLEIGFTGNYENLKPFLDSLENRIEKLPSISGVDLIGAPDQEVEIFVDPDKARSKLVGLRTIADAIAKRDIEGSGGTFEGRYSEKKVVCLNKFADYRDVLDTNLIMNFEGYGVKLRDVANVQIVPEDRKLLVRTNGKPGAFMAVRKTGSSDIIKSVESVKTILKDVKLPPGVKMTLLSDGSSRTSGRINLLIGNAVIGFILVMAVLFMIFDIRTAIWTAFGIPFTLLGMFIFLRAYGLTLNLISLGGFVIIIGMLVDDAIVIAERFNTNREDGLPPKDAAVDAVKSMWMPVISSALTTMIAFSPIFSIGGFPGKFIWTIPLMVIVGLVISLFESLLLLPSHLAHEKKEKSKTVTKNSKGNFVLKIEALYERLLHKTVKYKYFILIFLIIALVFSVYIRKNHISKEAFPQQASEGIRVAVNMPKGILANDSKKIIKQIENKILKLPKKELIGISTRVGTQSESTTTDRGTQYNVAIIFVYLTPYSERSRTAQEMIEELSKKIPSVINKRKISIAMSIKRMGPPIGRDFEVRVISNNDKLRAIKVSEIKKYLSTLKGIRDVEDDRVEGKNELNVKIKHDLLARTGLTEKDVLTTLRIAFDGLIVADMINLNGKMDYRLRLSKKGRGNLYYIKHLPIMNRFGNLINLGEFVSIKEQPSKTDITHINGKRSITIYGNADVNIIDPPTIMEKLQKQFKSNNNVSIEYSGQPVETKKIFAGLGSSAILAIVGVFLIISLMFNSYSKSFLIILTLPFIIIGVTFAQFTHGIPNSMMMGMATVGLLGIVVNNSIVMVHTIGGIADGGQITNDLIIKGAVSRLRPILLTSITTILGILPTGYGIGGYDPTLSQMAIGLAYGLMFSSLIVLFLVPIFYFISLEYNALTRRKQLLLIDWFLLFFYIIVLIMNTTGYHIKQLQPIFIILIIFHTVQHKKMLVAPFKKMFKSKK